MERLAGIGREPVLGLGTESSNPGSQISQDLQLGGEVTHTKKKLKGDT